MPKLGALVRFNDNLKVALLREVGDAAVRDLKNDLAEKEDKLTAKIIKRWIGDEDAHRLFAQIPEHWLPEFHSIDLRVARTGKDYISLKIERRPLPATPAWDRSTPRYSSYFLSLQEWDDEIEEIHNLRMAISSEVARIRHHLKMALSGLRYVRDVRELLPELDAFLPPDRYNSSEPVPVSRALAIDYGEIREMLKQHKIGVPEA